MIRLYEESDVQKIINRGDIFYCRLNSPNDEELKNNQFLIGKIRPCLIIGTLSYPFYQVIPIRTITESDFFNRENSYPIRLEKDHESILDFSQTRPVHYKNIMDYIGTIHNEDTLSDIEKMLLQNYELSNSVIYLDPFIRYIEKGREKIENILKVISDGLENGKSVNIKIGYEGENDDKIQNNEDDRIEEIKEYRKRVRIDPDKYKYIKWSENEKEEFEEYARKEKISLPYLKEKYGINSLYEFSKIYHELF